MGEHLDALRAHLVTIRHLTKAAALLKWDQETYMPPAGARARAEQLATLTRLAHERFASSHTDLLLQLAEREASSLSYDSDDASVVRVARRDYDQARRLPADLVAEQSRHSAIAHEVWVAARRTNDYALFAPYLRTTLDLARRQSDLLGYVDCPYDPLLDIYEPGMKTVDVRSIFDELKRDLVPLVVAINESADRISDTCLRQHFDDRGQERFGVMVAERLGYSFERGRLDRVVHPFETSFSSNDVRITTRYEDNFLSPAIFGIMHESGHALYEQGISPTLDNTPLGRGTSSVVHESSSRLWENLVGRSRAFWTVYYPQLQRTFPAQLSNVDLETFYGAVNRVQAAFIRVEADEVTYNLHIMLRFEIEVALLDGSLSVEGAPARWNDAMHEYLGIRPASDTAGILQDVHWSSNLIGYFPTYALGNIFSLQLYRRALQDDPDIAAQAERGEYTALRTWLTDRIYRHGRKFSSGELIQRATGESLNTRAYMAYLKEKFGDLYGL